MARSGKVAIVLCLDVGFTMSSSAPGEESSLEQAKKVMTKFVQRQVFAESKDEVAVVLFGTDGTRNDLASRDQYQNITVHRSLMLPDFDLLEDIQDMIKPGSEKADFLDAIIVCMDLLQKQTVGKKYEKRHIELFTDLCSPVSEDQLEIIIANLKKTGISLQFFLPFPVDVDDGGGDTSASAHSHIHKNPFPRKGLTEQQEEGIDVVRKLMHALDEEGGLEEIYTFRESLEHLSMFKKIERRPMAWPCQLTIGSNLSIRIVAYKSVTEEKVKKVWTTVDAKTLRKDDVRRETVYCLNDDDETEVQKDDTIQGFRYGSDIVPFSKEDEEQMKYKTEAKCFSVLGFSRSSQIQRHCYMGNQVLKVFAAKNDENAAVAFSALVHALDELKVVAVVRYAYDRRSNPQIGAAFPYIKDAYECLQHKAFHPNEPLPPIEEHLLEMLEMPGVVKERCQGPLEKVKSLFPLKEVVKKKDKKTAQDIFKDNSEDGPNPKKPRIEDEEGSFSIMKLAEGNVTSVGSVNPAEDFRILVRQKNADFKDVSQQLINRISQFLENKGSQYYMKGINCIRVFREEAVKLSKVQCFNDFLQALKSKVEDKALADFWEIMMQDRISLITKDEAKESSVTSEEAEKFLAPKEKKNEILPPADEGGDVDDLLDMM
ncbi:X-ray repair cross-complementing protein 5 isoform X2 [Lathamus discolor]|uniref:X-ray repair cross-complementing protein 5 isoform X2 n=1 Tax=Lathamus discolor TaxID=678569 RepID=UPI0032B748DE